MKKYNVITLILALVIFSLSSCKSTKSVAYFQNADTVKLDVTKGDYSLKLIPADVINVTISSLVPEATDIFRFVPAPTDGSTFNPTTRYVIAENGTIEIPVLGTIKAAGCTTRELAEVIRKKVAETVADPIVDVKLQSFRVNVLGEVRNPGAKEAKSERYTIMDALADAGDITMYGIRTNVMLIREEKGVKSFHRLDLTDANLINSDYYYLKQNDVIYVEPDKVKVVNSEYNQNNAFKVSVISTVVSALSVIASMIIAITVK